MYQVGCINGKRRFTIKNFALRLLSRVHFIYFSNRAYKRILHVKLGRIAPKSIHPINQLPMGALFIDCDGTLYKDGIEIQEVDLAKFYPRVCEFVKSHRRNGDLVVLVTNQSKIARSNNPSFAQFLRSWRDIRNICKLLEIDVAVSCTHHIDSCFPSLKRVCDFRKPNSLSALKIFKHFVVTQSRSVMLGDRVSDMAYSHNARLFQGVLLLNDRMFELNKEMLARPWDEPIIFKVRRHDAL